MTDHNDPAMGKAVADSGKYIPKSPTREEQLFQDDLLDGAVLLDDLLAAFRNYVAFPDEHAAVATTLWTATTHALPAFECAPRLVANSPQKQCGKTRLLDVITGTCHAPLATVNATVAAIYRSLGGAHPPTLILDEADAIFGTKRVAENNEDLRALINAGHQRGRPALRCVGPNQIPTEFNTFAMVALAGIGTMPDTITDRAINFTMRRRTRTEKVSQFRSRRDGPVLAEVRDRLASWAADQLDELKSAEPDMPVEDRAADTWEPLIAVADAAGGHWPRTARAACKALVDGAADADEAASLAVQLLVDIRQIFTDKRVAFLSTADLLAELRRIEESPWDDFELNSRKLAQRLRQFGIKPGRAERNTVRGYELEAFTDAFLRYTRPHPSKPSATDVDQPQHADGSKGADTSIRPQQNMCPQQTAGQTELGTGWTGEDAPPAENGSTAGVSAPPPATGRCTACGTELLPSNHTGLCAECTHVARQRVLAERLGEVGAHE